MEYNIRFSNFTDTDDKDIVTRAIIFIGIALTSDSLLIGWVIVTDEVN